MRRSVGGMLGMRELAMLSGSDLDARSRQHRPLDRATLRSAALELARRGLTARDVSEALGLSEAIVRALLEVAP